MEYQDLGHSVSNQPMGGTGHLSDLAEINF